MDAANYLPLASSLISSLLALGLLSATKNLLGRNWLIAFAGIGLIGLLGWFIIQTIALGSSGPGSDFRSILSWHEVLNAFRVFGPACLAVFIFINWSNGRYQLDVKKLFFSFSGRIPRSAFWISLSILVPIGLIVGYAPILSESEGAPLIALWAMYAVWVVLGGWIVLAVYAKRWHDCSKSGWFTLVSLIPIVGFIGMIIYLGVMRGTNGENRFGEDPLDV